MIERRSFGLRDKALSEVIAPSNAECAVKGIQGNEPHLVVGLGRSYGDVGLINGGRTLATTFMNKFLGFDRENGLLNCEAGVTLADIQSTFVKQGWMLPVTPGTSFVSVGGAIANDVHGKDHHTWGTFGEHVVGIKLARSNGEIIDCSLVENPQLFKATIGGLGLTGLILEATIRLRPSAGPYVDAENLTFYNLKEFFKLSTETSSQGWQASVAWFDCSTSRFGRGSLTRGNPSLQRYDPATDDAKLESLKAKLAVPITPPFSLVNKASLDAFNHAYFNLQRAKSGKQFMHFKDFYYPLDGISNWNRIYGHRGFFQYQSVIPAEFAEDATQEMLANIRRSGQGSFLGVLKIFSKREPAGLLSFAREGTTLALDFPDRGPVTMKLFERLDAIVSEAGGRLNPSKDGRMSRQMFEAGFPNLAEFLKHRDPGFVSEFSRRLID